MDLGSVRPFDADVLAGSGEYPRPKAVPLKVLEESAELVEASKAWLKAPDGPRRRDMLDELADVLQTVANLCSAFDVTDGELWDAERRCEERNRARGRMS